MVDASTLRHLVGMSYKFKSRSIFAVESKYLLKSISFTQNKTRTLLKNCKSIVQRFVTAEMMLVRSFFLSWNKLPNAKVYGLLLAWGWCRCCCGCWCCCCCWMPLGGGGGGGIFGKTMGLLCNDWATLQDCNDVDDVADLKWPTSIIPVEEGRHAASRLCSQSISSSSILFHLYMSFFFF